jgi:hypothetical protein
MSDKEYWVDFDLNTDSFVTRERDQDDKWDAGDERVVFYGVTAYRRAAGKNGYAEDNVPDLGTPIYVLIEVYDSGSTFGSSKGNVEVESWHLSYEAAKARSLVAPKDCDYFGGHVEWRIEVTELRER